MSSCLASVVLASSLFYFMCIARFTHIDNNKSIRSAQNHKINLVGFIKRLPKIARCLFLLDILYPLASSKKYSYYSIFALRKILQKFSETGYRARAKYILRKDCFDLNFNIVAVSTGNWVFFRRLTTSPYY